MKCFGNPCISSPLKHYLFIEGEEEGNQQNRKTERGKSNFTLCLVLPLNFWRVAPFLNEYQSKNLPDYNSVIRSRRNQPIIRLISNSVGYRMQWRMTILLLSIYSTLFHLNGKDHAWPFHDCFCWNTLIPLIITDNSEMKFPVWLHTRTICIYIKLR